MSFTKRSQYRGAVSERLVRIFLPLIAERHGANPAKVRKLVHLSRTQFPDQHLPPDAPDRCAWSEIASRSLVEPCNRARLDRLAGR